MKSRPWGRKTPSASTHRPRRLSHPPRPRLHFRARVHTSPVCVCTSPSAFTLPPHRLPRPPQSNRHPAAAVIHNGLSTEKLSTSLPAVLCKTFSPSRLRTRIYNISFARRPLPGSVRAVVPPCPAPPCAGWGRAKAKADGPLAQCRTMPLVCRITVCKGGVHKAKADAPSRSAPYFPRLRPSPCPPTAESLCAKAEVHKAIPAPAVCSPRVSPPTAAPPPPKWAPRLRRREGKPPNGAPPHRNAHTPNAERKRYLHNSRTKTQRRTKRCAQFVIFVFTPCKLLHNFSTVLHRSPRNVPKRAQIAVRRSDFPCFTARFPNVLPESHRAKHPRTAPVLPPKNAPLRAYAKPRPHSRVRGTRQHATTCAFFTFSARYERVGGTRNANFCPAEGRKWGRFRSQMLKNGPQTKKSTFSFGRLVI